MKFPQDKNKGQTLIETLVAAFMLVTGVAASVGLAIYALNQSTNITKQIVAAGLAREGVEAVKNMRDSNWLQQLTVDKDCYDYLTGTNIASCKKQWLEKLYCIDPKKNSGSGNCNGNGSNSNDFFVSFDSASADFWVIVPYKNGAKPFGLQFDEDNSDQKGFYNTNGTSGVQCASAAGVSDFCRKIIITLDTSKKPYDRAEYPLLKVQSRVWWVDRKCPRSDDWPASGSCSVEIESYLTNWKDY